MKKESEDRAPCAQDHATERLPYQAPRLVEVVELKAAVCQFPSEPPPPGYGP